LRKRLKREAAKAKVVQPKILEHPPRVVAQQMEDLIPPVSEATAKKRRMRADPEFWRESILFMVISAEKIQVKNWRRMLCVSV